MDWLALDRKLFFAINHELANAAFDLLFPLLTRRGYLFFLPFLFYAFWRGFAERKQGAPAFLKDFCWVLFLSTCAFLICDLLSNQVKHLVARPRPPNVLDGVRLLVGSTAKANSFPSSHASNAFAFTLPMVYLLRGSLSSPWRIYLLSLPVLISFSRVYVGVHYPSDVAGGIMLGTIVASLSILLFVRARRHYGAGP